MRSDRRSRFWPLGCAALLLVGGTSAAHAQQATPVAANAAPAPAPGDFAPGVLTTIPPSVDREDVISSHDVPEILADKSLEWTPSSTTKSRTLFEMAKDAVFINDVWCLEFAFKPLRMIEVDVPQPSGRVQRKNIWYMVYRVRNTGAGLTGKANDDGTFETAAKSTDEIRFVPELVLASNDRSAGQRVRKAYLDRIVPAALGPIQQRELPRGELFNSAELATQLLKIEGGRTQQGVWGVAMWEDVDPQIDFFSIYVRGLSNGLAWTDPPGALKLGDPPGTGRKFTYKTLQLNFWRPGDDIGQTEREIRFGTAPQRADFYDSGEGVAYRWVYR
ncbi:hypothetical protein [Lacipirellula limnantheis]|nr:hypothetical protein [Lacipirellula limnantheis]